MKEKMTKIPCKYKAKELNGDKNRKEFYKVGTDNEEEEPVMKMKLISVKKKDSKKSDNSAAHGACQRFVGIAYNHVKDAKNYVMAVEKKCVGMDLQEAEDINADLDDLKGEVTSLIKLIDKAMAKVDQQG